MSLLQMSFSGTILIAVILIIRALTIHRLPKRTFLVLWSIALFRLLLPFSVPSVFSIYSVLLPDTPIPAAAAGLPAAAISTANASAGHTFITQGQFESVYETTLLPVHTQPQVSVWSAVWLAGLALCAAFFIISYLRCLMEFRASLPVQNASVKKWAEKHPLRRPLSIRVSDRTLTPLTYGILRPVILMPQSTDWENQKQLHYILLHEYVHIRRFDTVLKLIVILAVCIHWFNPFVWVLYFLFNRDIELACDEGVVQRLGQTSRSDYARILIHMEAAKSGLAPFCNHFSKTAIEERITAIMKTKKTTFLAVLAAILLVIVIAAAFATSASGRSGKADSASDSAQKEAMIPGIGFTENDFAKLLALQFDGYEEMTVSAFQQKVRETTDTAEYTNLLERFSQSEAFYEKKNENETASFFFYLLEPLTAQQWQERTFGGYSLQYNRPGSLTPATLEYSITLSVLNADTLTVREYKEARLDMLTGLRDILHTKTSQQLQDETFMQNAIRTEIDRLTEQLNTDALQITVAYVFTPLSALSSESSQTLADQEPYTEEEEPRLFPNGTEEHYRSLLALKTADYQDRSVADFNQSFLEWANENNKRHEGIFEDVRRNDYQVDLTDEQLSFITLTASLSNTENFREIQSELTGEPQKDPGRTYNFTKESSDALIWCSLEYEFTYHLTDKQTITIGERDRQIAGMISHVQQFWNETSPGNLADMGKDEILETLQDFAAQYSNANIVITIEEEHFFFEAMDETATAEGRVLRDADVYYLLCDGASEADAPTVSVTEGSISFVFVRKDSYTTIGPFDDKTNLVNEVTEYCNYLLRSNRSSLSSEEMQLVLKTAGQVEIGLL